MSQQANIAATQRLGEAVNSGNLEALNDNGQIVERWGSSDQLGILQQIGVNPLNP